MSFISTIAVQDAKDEVRAIYEQNQAVQGYVPNYIKLFSHRPQVAGTWGNLLGSIRSNLDLRRYELVTIAAAKGLNSTYCMMAHCNVLLKNNFQSQEIETIAKDHTKANISPVEVAIMSYAEKIAKDASSITAEDIQNLREHGLTDTEIFDIAATAAARCFFSKLLDALGAQADSVFLNLDESLRETLTVGREMSIEAVEQIK